MFICIARTDVDWQTLLDNAQKALSRSVSASLDSGSLPVIGVPSFLAAIAEFETKGTDAIRSIRTNTLIRRHAMFSFLVNLSREHFFTLQSLGLTVSPASDGDFAIVSARLSEWVHAVVDGTEQQPLRKLFCSFLAWFERENLGEIWSTWEKVHLADEGLFVLRRV